MKALSFWPSWLWCTLHAGKLIDNRKQAWTYRGPLLLHASLASKADWELASLLCREITGCEVPKPEELPQGGIIGRADLVDVIRKGDNEKAASVALTRRIDLRWWFPDHVGLVLDNVQPLPFRRYKGQLGLFEVPD